MSQEDTSRGMWAIKESTVGSDWLWHIWRISSRLPMRASSRGDVRKCSGSLRESTSTLLSSLIKYRRHWFYWEVNNAFEGVCCSYQAFWGRGHGVWLDLHAKETRGKKTKMLCDQTHSNGCVRPGLSCFSLVWGVAPGDLENRLKFTGTDQDVRAHLSCLPRHTRLRSSFGAHAKPQLQIAPLSYPFFFFFLF